MNHPPPNQTWPDVYEHCHRCEKIKQKLDMANIDTHHYCVDCVPVVFASQQAAIQLLATEVAWRRKVGYCPNEAYEAVSNNQTCRTALTDAGHKPITFSKEDVR